MKKIILISISLILLVIMPLVFGCSQTIPPPELTQQQKTFAIQTIMDYPEVRDADIIQEGKVLSLAIIVGYATSEERARQLGDNFVRLVKTFGPDSSPGKIIGQGTYDYLIAVATPDQRIIVQGAKVNSSDHITW